MPRVLRREALTGEHMAQMSIAVRAANFGAPAIRVWNLLHGTRDFLVETRPATTGMKFGIRRIQFRIAASTCVRALAKFVIVLARKWRFGTSVFDDVLLLRRQIIPGVHARILRACSAECQHHGFLVPLHGETVVLQMLLQRIAIVRAVL